VEDSRLVALFAVGDLGRSEAFIVVHRDYRNRGIAKELMRRMCEAIPCLYVRVAEDNRASLRLCEASGFHPYARTLGPTGKPTILLIRHGNLNS
ncbi:GNAT family N-acetyltransferase, partial [Frankia sp. Cpl3]|nr:GNAT family N-acetyltransferase [Frankia sp. Cpl3]